MTVTITPPDTTRRQPGKLADAELHFDEADGALAGLKLVGFAIWRDRHSGALDVAFPAREYAVHGTARSFVALLRPTADPAAANRLRDLMLAAYAAWAQQRAAVSA